MTTYTEENNLNNNKIYVIALNSRYFAGKMAKFLRKTDFTTYVIYCNSFVYSWNKKNVTELTRTPLTEFKQDKKLHFIETSFSSSELSTIKSLFVNGGGYSWGAFDSNNSIKGLLLPCVRNNNLRFVGNFNKSISKKAFIILSICCLTITRVLDIFLSLLKRGKK